MDARLILVITVFRVLSQYTNLTGSPPYECADRYVYVYIQVIVLLT